MKRKLIRGASVFLALALTVTGFAGCGSSSSQDAGSSNEAAAASDELIKVDFGVDNAGVGGILPVIAAYGDIDEEFGLDFQLQPIGTASDTLAAVQSGKVLVSGFSAPAPLLSISEGSDFEIIGGLMGDYESFITKPENADQWRGEFTAELLAGKKIGVNRTNSGDIALRAYLADKGIDLSTITYVELDSAATVIEAVSKGTVDAGIINGAFYLSAETQGLENVRFVKDIIGSDFICCRLLATPDTVANDRETLVKIQKALIKAYELYRSDEDRTVELALNYVTKSEEDIRFLVYEYGDLLLSPDPFIEGIVSYYDGMKASGYIDPDTNVDIRDHVDTSIFGDALNELLEAEPDNKYLIELRDSFKEKA